MATGNAEHDATTPETAETAHVLFLDIVGYSTLPNDDQVKAVRLLTAEAKNAPEYKRRLEEKEVVPIPTGDGMALLFKRFPEAPARCALELDLRPEYRSPV